jgi:hypothetical protein
MITRHPRLRPAHLAENQADRHQGDVLLQGLCGVGRTATGMKIGKVAT